jgi:hypothetical protein
MDLKELKAEYSFKIWLRRMNYFVCDGKTSKQSGLQELLPDGHCPPINRKESLEFEETELDNWWYEHYKDFSRYETWHYLYAGLNCFDRFSKPCAFYAQQYLGRKKIKTIVDVGAGIGLSTMLLADLFPETKVYYNNIFPSLQHSFFETYKDKRVIFSENQTESITEKEMMQHGPFDMLFASEYFEHFEEPMKQTHFLLDQVGFKYLVVNNSFNVKAYGHFNEYEGDDSLTPKEMSRLWLRNARCEYNELKVKCWNGRPKIFEKK